MPHGRYSAHHQLKSTYSCKLERDLRIKSRIVLLKAGGRRSAPRHSGQTAKGMAWGVARPASDPGFCERS
jgi:hypothetical protein